MCAGPRTERGRTEARNLWRAQEWRGGRRDSPRRGAGGLDLRRPLGSRLSYLSSGLWRLLQRHCHASFPPPLGTSHKQIALRWHALDPLCTLKPGWLACQEPNGAFREPDIPKGQQTGLRLKLQRHRDAGGTFGWGRDPGCGRGGGRLVACRCARRRDRGRPCRRCGWQGTAAGAPPAAAPSRTPSACGKPQRSKRVFASLHNSYLQMLPSATMHRTGNADEFTTCNKPSTAGSFARGHPVLGAQLSNANRNSLQDTVGSRGAADLRSPSASRGSRAAGLRWRSWRSSGWARSRPVDERGTRRSPAGKGVTASAVVYLTQAEVFFEKAFERYTAVSGLQSNLLELDSKLALDIDAHTCIGHN